MDEEQVLNQQQADDSGRVSLLKILFALRAHLLFIVIITVLFAAGGFAYSKLAKPVYTATVPVQFDVSGIKKGETGEEDQASNTTYLFAYLDTAVGICTSGKTIDRANVYYAYYLDYLKKYPDSNVNDFIKDLYKDYETVKTTTERAELPNYPVTTEKLNQFREYYFTADKFGTNYKYSSNSSDANASFSLWVKDLDSQCAKDMACIYTFAADFSLNKILQFDKTGNAGIINLAGSSKGVTMKDDISSNKIVIIAAAMGLVLSLISVYIFSLLDNTVKSKEQLESISGTGVIAYVDDISGVK